MTELKNKELTGRIIAAAVNVHRTLGPGFLESIYEKALCLELEAEGIAYECQKPVEVRYMGQAVGEHRLDLLVEQRVVVELKAVKTLEDIFFAVVRSYLKAVGIDTGLIINFASMPLTIKRVTRERLQL